MQSASWARATLGETEEANRVAPAPAGESRGEAKRQGRSQGKWQGETRTGRAARAGLGEDRAPDRVRFSLSLRVQPALARHATPSARMPYTSRASCARCDRDENKKEAAQEKQR